MLHVVVVILSKKFDILSVSICVYIQRIFFSAENLLKTETWYFLLVSSFEQLGENMMILGSCLLNMRTG